MVLTSTLKIHKLNFLLTGLDTMVSIEIFAWQGL